MFAFGFGGLIVMTQMHGLELTRLARGAILAVYAALVTVVYADRGWGRIDEIVRIPIIEVLAALVLAGLFAATLARLGAFARLPRRPERRARPWSAGSCRSCRSCSSRTPPWSCRFCSATIHVSRSRRSRSPPPW